MDRLRLTAKLFDIYLDEHGGGDAGNISTEYNKYSGARLYDLGNNEEYFAEYFEARNSDALI